ncbi:MAG: hypothetical protein AB1461_16930 [Thermodesulfobacteriota bacterium]
MARRILVVDLSASMRRILRTMILATVNDTEVDEASDAREAVNLLQQKNYHVVLFTPESSTQSWFDFLQKSSQAADEKQKTSYVVFTSSRKQDYLQQVKRYGVNELLEIPCTPEAVGELINRTCSTFALRANRRYNFPGTTVAVEQSGRSFQAEVVNFSEGGLLCDLIVPEGFDWSATSVINLGFSIENRIYEVPGIMSALSRLQVVEAQADYAPKRIRLAFRFVSMPRDSSEKLGEVIRLLEKMECFEPV